MTEIEKLDKMETKRRRLFVQTLFSLIIQIAGYSLIIYYFGFLPALGVFLIQWAYNIIRSQLKGRPNKSM